MTGARGSVDALDVERLAARRGYVTLFAGLGFTIAGGEGTFRHRPQRQRQDDAAAHRRRTDHARRRRSPLAATGGSPIRSPHSQRGCVQRPSPALKDELTAQENLEISVALDERPAAAEAIAAALEAVALTRQKALPVRFLSQGQRRRIGLARLHLSQRPLWILDEPLTALDADAIDLLGALLERHLDRGGLCVAASHQPLPVAVSRMRSITLGASAPA
jgi:heme exporter protein A